MTDHLAGKRLQIVRRFVVDRWVFTFQVYSGSHFVCEIACSYSSIEEEREDQKRLAKILGFKATHKIRKIK